MLHKNRKALFGLMAIAAFVLMVVYIPVFFTSNVPSACFEGGECQHEEYVQSMITYLPAVIVLGFLSGVLASFFYFERKIELPSAPPDRRQALLSMLPSDERKIIGRIAERKGEALQSELSRIEGVGKVRAHRVVEKLSARGILEKRQMGKTNIILLKKEIREALES